MRRTRRAQGLILPPHPPPPTREAVALQQCWNAVSYVIIRTRQSNQDPIQSQSG